VSNGSTFKSLVVGPANSKLSRIIVIYRRPTTLLAQFCSDFSDVLNKVLHGKRSVILAGDFNIHVDDINDPNAKSFLDILSVFGLSLHIKDSTHGGGHTPDLLITHYVVPSTITVSPPHLTDHCSPSFSLPTTPQLR